MEPNTDTDTTDHAAAWEDLARRWILSAATLASLERRAEALRPLIISPGGGPLTNHIGRGLTIMTGISDPIQHAIDEARRTGFITADELDAAENV